MKLFLCANCNRHIKDDRESCPFCGATARGQLVGDASRVVPRMGRSALAVGAGLGAAVALAMTDCSSAEYGGPPFDGSYPEIHTVDAPHEAESSTDASDASDAPVDAADASD